MDNRLRYAPIELRAAATPDAPQGILEGYASVYDVEYRIGYGLNEAIAPGAFSDSLAKRDNVLPVFYQHDWNNPIGYARASEDEKGLHVQAHLFTDVNPTAASVYAATAAGALREWSIGFVPTTIETRSEDQTADAPTVEYVLAADLLEASVVVKGANPATEMVGVRAEVAEETVPEMEDAPPAEATDGPLLDAAADLVDDPALPEHLLDNIDKEYVRDILRDRLN